MPHISQGTICAVGASLQQAFNLSQLRKELEKYPEYKDFRQKVERYLSAKSFESDLSSALKSIDALRVIDANADANARQIYGQALMAHALMMYCRAAIEDGNGRGKMGVTKAYTADQRSKHQDIVKLRNKNLAHFGVGEGRYGAQWTTELAIFRVTDEVEDISYAWSRVNYLAILIYDLHELCHVAIESVGKAARERELSLLGEIERLVAKDKQFLELVQRYPFDPTSFYQTEAGVTDFWAPGANAHEVNTPRLVSDALNLQLGPAVGTRVG